MKLTSANGEDFCGFVGIGGNNDTVHFQINGKGCKHVFARRAPWSLHDWLTNVLGVQTLARVDLAYDDYDGIFDCEYARTAPTEGSHRDIRSCEATTKHRATHYCRSWALA
ncbi:hypothetical protein [Vibrio harveyi]|uniref:hypothetical protein n=1 Tax=Vibrio harveyi TaxID=669 RepID=UPI0024816A99|nr:hypothetical protein [Vibrio harveyi]